MLGLIILGFPVTFFWPPSLEYGLSQDLRISRKWSNSYLDIGGQDSYFILHRDPHDLFWPLELMTGFWRTRFVQFSLARGVKVKEPKEKFGDKRRKLKSVNVKSLYLEFKMLLLHGMFLSQRKTI